MVRQRSCCSDLASLVTIIVSPLFTVKSVISVESFWPW